MTKSSRWSFDEKEMTSIISGHGINEAVGRWFVGQSINTSSQFNDYVQTVFGNQTSPKLVRLFARLQDLYPAVEAPNYPFKTTNERVARYTADIGVNCHHRALTQTYLTLISTYQTSFWGETQYMDQFPAYF